MSLSPCAGCSHAQDHHLGCRTHEGCCGADHCTCLGFQPRRACTAALALACTAADGMPCADCADESLRWRATASMPRREEWVETLGMWLGVPADVASTLFDRLQEPPALFRISAIVLLARHVRAEDLEIAVQAAMYARDELP